MSKTDKEYIFGKSTTEIRRELHRHPEVSGKEEKTAERIAGYLHKVEDIQIKKNVGDHGIIAVKRYGPGKVIGFRAELDALPIAELNDLPHTSKVEGVSHVCGHDGHMAMVLDMVEKLEAASIQRGTVVLFFQSAEETGAGADLMMNDIENGDVDIPIPEICFAIHNIPGLALGKVSSKDDVFACGSVGMMARIEGKTAHAAHPESAVNPLIMACELMQYGQNLPEHEDVSGFALCTPISLHSGSDTFGTSPPDATLQMTFRAAENEALEKMMELIKTEAETLTSEAGASLETSFVEHFPSTVNTPVYDKVESVCKEAGIECTPLKEPFRWSEDFAHFSRLCPIFLMGVGSGTDQPALHNPDFDFPDALNEIGGALYAALYKSFSQ